MSYRLIPHHIHYFSDIEICIVWRKIGVWRGANTSQTQYLSHFIYPNSSSSGNPTDLFVTRHISVYAYFSMSLLCFQFINLHKSL